MNNISYLIFIYSIFINGIKCTLGISLILSESKLVSSSSISLVDDCYKDFINESRLINKLNLKIINFNNIYQTPKEFYSYL
jgi:hypothetical protein